MRKLKLPVIGLVFLLGGCGGVTVSEYAGNTPKLDPEIFFNGRLVAHGVIKNRGGKVIRRFRADINAGWSDGVGTLDERFVFDDGELDRRVWTLRNNPGGGYTGTAGDVIGDGAITVAGNAMFLDYVLRVPRNDSSIDLRIDDRMYLVSPDVLINESIMTKFGIRVGQILLTIRRLPN